MAPRESSLLCLVLCLGQRIRAQEGDLPTPVLAAVPGPAVPWNGSVSLRCRGTPASFLHQLLFLGNATRRVVERRLGFQEEAEFLLDAMDAVSAGRYCCQYREGLRWSPQSAALELVVTGLYDKPLLSTDQSLVLALGSYVSLWCGSAHIPFDGYSLVKDGVPSMSQRQHMDHQGNFTLGPVNPSFAGEYRCYGWHSSNPYVWSAPSDALELVIADPSSRDHRMGTWIRMGLAGLVLLALLAVLGELWHSLGAPTEDGWRHQGGPACSTQECGREGTRVQPPVDLN